MEEIARGVAVIPMTIANAYLVGTRESWTLVDSGIPGNVRGIRNAAESMFGVGARPRAIVVTHGHFDHAGSAAPLADEWQVPIYAHRLELAYLTGRSTYPPLDATAPGFFCGLSRLFPSRTVNLGQRVQPFADDPLPGWEMHQTPGHTPGHVSFFRRADGVLLAGDALTTMDLDSLIATLTKRKEVCRPPVPATSDWVKARRSVELLAGLDPEVIAAGHGAPMHGAAEELRRFAANFRPPSHGRYVTEPVRSDENGVQWLPPKPPDVVPAIAAGVAAGIAVLSVAYKLWNGKARTAADE